MQLELEEQIIPLRTQIDEIDKQLLILLNNRANLAKQIGDIKNKFNSPIFKPEREKLILQSLEKNNCGPLNNNSINSIWREIMSACRSLEGEHNVAFLGPSGTFSQQAMLAYFGAQTKGVSCNSIDEVFKTIETGQTEFAILPIENSSEGAVSRTLDLLLHCSSHIIGEIIIEINHHLLSKHQDFKHAINMAKTIAAHPQALAQCQSFLNSIPKLNYLERKAVASNAYAAELAMEDESILAIASEQAASQYNLFKIKQHIQDETNNRTRFIVLGEKSPNATGNDQTSLIFATQNEAGAILKAIAPFAKHEVSMSRLQSRPYKQPMGKNKEWEYLFLVDIDGHIEDKKVSQAIQEVQQNTKFMKWLGSYAKLS